MQAKTVRKRSYSDREKATALAALDFHGGNLSAASKALGVPIKTLSDWRDGAAVNADVAEFRNEEKANLVEMFEQVIVAGLRAKLETPEKLSGVDIGIFTDKMNVLRGAPDSISKSIAADPEQRQARILELVRKAGVE